MITVIGSLKGGSGKSTITFNLAVWLATAGQEIEVVDADPQGTLSDVADVRAEEGYEPLIEVKKRVVLETEELGTKDELQSARDIAWETYTALENTASEVQVTSLTPDAVVRVADAALTPTTPIGRNIVSNTVIAVVLGLIAGVLIALLIEYYKNSNGKTEAGEKEEEAN